MLENKINNKCIAGILSLIAYYLETNQIIISDFKWVEKSKNDELTVEYYNPKNADRAGINGPINVM